MTAKLFVSAIIKYLLGVILLGVLIFLPAGSFAYINGWVLMGLLFVPMFLAGVVMMFKNPKLLKERLDTKEKQRRTHIGIYMLQSVSFPATHHQKTTAGVSLAVVFFFVLQKNRPLWSALQF